MANPFPFTAGQVLTAAQMNGIGEATIAYTPTITNGTLGNGTLTAVYTRVNKMVYGLITLTLGTTSTITGTLTFTLPVTAAANSQFAIIGNGFYTDASAGLNYQVTSYRSSTTTVYANAINASATYSYVVPVGATVPMVPATSDLLAFTFQYEAA